MCAYVYINTFRETHSVHTVRGSATRGKMFRHRYQIIMANPHRPCRSLALMPIFYIRPYLVRITFGG